MTRRKKETYEVRLHRPEGVSVKELQIYMEEAIYDWGGQFPDSDPLFYPWKRSGPKRVMIRRRA